MTDLAVRAPVGQRAMLNPGSLLKETPALAPPREKISVRRLNFYYQDGTHALKDVTAPIYQDRVTALIGPSGCGKSTLLRAAWSRCSAPTDPRTQRFVTGRFG